MNKCKNCGHEGDDDVTDYIIHDKDWNLHHNWYCNKCKTSWFIVEPPYDEATSFNFRR